MTEALRVLLVEDNPGDERLIREHLSEMQTLQLKTTSCASLDSGLAYLETATFDLVLLDLSLPDSIGANTVRSVIAKHPSLPVIVLTGTTDRQLADEALHLGAQDYLSKSEMTAPLLERTIAYAIERHRARSAIRESEARFRAIFQASPIPVVIAKPGGKGLIAANEAYCEMMGYSQDEIGALSIAETTHPEDLEEDLKGIRAVLDDRRKTFSREKRLIRKDGQIIWAQVTGSVLRDETGTPEQVLVVQQDITAEREATNALRAEQERLSSVMESMPAFLYLQGPDYKVRYFNTRFAEYFGDPNGRSCHQIFRCQDVPCDTCPTLSVLNNGGEIVREWTDIDGRVFEIRERPFLSQTGEDLALVIGTEITDLVKASKAVRASEQRFRELAEMLPETVFECDLDGQLTYVNEIAGVRFGYTAEDFHQGLNAFDMLAPEDRAAARETVSSLDQRSDTMGQQFTAIRQDGSRFPVIVHASLVLQDELPVGLRGIIIDFTEQAEAQRAIEESEARLRQLFESAPIGIGYHALDGTTLAMNETAASRLIGQREDYLGKKLMEYAKNPDQVEQRFALAAASNSGNVYEDEVERTNGTFWYQRTYTAIRDASGAPVGIQVISSDITAIKQAQDAMQMAEDIVRSTPVGMFIYKYEAEDRLILVDANLEAERLTGLNLADWQGKEFNELWPHARAIGFTQSLLDAFQGNSLFSTDDLEYSDHRTAGLYRIRAFRIPEDRLVVSFEDVSELRQAERALRDSELKYRSLFENAALGIYQTTPDGRIIAANPALVSMLGYDSFEELAARNLEGEGYAPTTPRSEFKTEIAQKGSISGRESLWKRKDGSMIRIREYARAVRNTEGRILYYEGTLEDITAETESARQLVESERRYRGIVESSPVGIVTVNRQGRIMSTNPAFLRMTGYHASDFEGHHFTKIPGVRAKDLPKYVRRFREIVAKRMTSPFTAAWKTKDGDTRHGEVQVAAHHNVGDDWTAQIIVQDVTERVKAQDAVRRSEAEYRSLFENSTLGIYRSTPDGRILTANPALIRLLGYKSLAELQTRDLEDDNYEQDTPRSEFKRKIEASGFISGHESAWRLHNGSTIYIREHARAVQNDDGEIEYYEGTLEDITEQKAFLAALERSEAMQRGILEASPVGTGLIQGETLQWVSDRVCEMTGYTAEQLIGQTPQITAPDEAEYRRIQQAMEADLQSKGVAQTETQWVRRDGSVFDADLRFASLDPQDPSKGGIFTVLDITERKAMERSLMLTQYSMDSTNVIILWLTPAGEVVYVNEAACRNLGYRRDDLLGKYVWEITPNYPKGRRASLWETLKVEGSETAETELICEDNTHRPVELTAQYLHFQEAEYEFVFAVDIRERKAAEEALRESEENYRAIFESASDVILLHDAVTGRVLEGNPKVEDLFGYTVPEFLELHGVESFSSGLPPYTQDEALRRIHAAAEGTPQVFEWHCKHRNGRLFWVEVSLRQAHVRGEDVVLAVVRDIDERKRLEAQLRQGQKLESIGTLASGVAHEINNPLMGMINYAELISSRVDDDSLREFAEGIKTEGDRVARIVRNLLSFSRQDQEEHSRARFSDIVDASLSLIGSLVRKDFIELQVDVPEDLPELRCRSQQIQQVIINLVTNARDSLNEQYPMAHENKVVRIQAQSLIDSDGEWLRATIEDTGIGIAEDVLDRIFDPFFTTKSRDEGTGLGLSISYGIVRDHGGRLNVESKPGVGTRFFVDLPAIPSDE